MLVFKQLKCTASGCVLLLELFVAVCFKLHF